MGNSLYDRLGGEAAIKKAVDIFYKHVMADQRINHFFKGVDMKNSSNKMLEIINAVPKGALENNTNIQIQVTFSLPIIPLERIDQSADFPMKISKLHSWIKIKEK